jgi:hypothetical protein
MAHESAENHLPGDAIRRWRRFLFQFSNTHWCFVLEIAILTPHPARSQLKVGQSVADGHIVFDGADKLSDEDAHRKMQALKLKKWTATMKRRALKPRFHEVAEHAPSGVGEEVAPATRPRRYGTSIEKSRA